MCKKLIKNSQQFGNFLTHNIHLYHTVTPRAVHRSPRGSNARSPGRYQRPQTCLAIRGRPKAEDLLSAENRNRNRKSIVSGPKPSASLMPACRGPLLAIPVISSVNGLGPNECSLMRVCVAEFTSINLSPMTICCCYVTTCNIIIA